MLVHIHDDIFQSIFIWEKLFLELQIIKFRLRICIVNMYYEVNHDIQIDLFFICSLVN